jgi:4-amino-4-deoxy-L-arabinose transferase-like glycosyltransferase
MLGAMKSKLGGEGSLFFCFASIFVFCLLLKIPSLLRLHRESDEIIYTTLAMHLNSEGVYSVQNTPISKFLDARAYDRPFFHHPPLYVFLMIPFLKYFTESSPVIISWIAHLLAVSVLYLFLCRKFRIDKQAFLLIPVLGMAFDPVLAFVSTRIWFDALLAALTFTSMAAFLWGYDSEKRKFYWLLAGVFLGLSILTKMPALLCGLFYFMFVAYEVFCKKDRLILLDSLFIFLPAVLISAPWFIKFYGHYGMLFPDWLIPLPELVKSSDFINSVVSRPVHYYFSQLVLLNPLVMFVVLLQIFTIKKIGRYEIMLWIWILMVIGAMTPIAAKGMGFQMRYIAMAVPPIYLLFAILLTKIPQRYLLIASTVSILLIVCNGMTNLFYIVPPNTSYGDIVSLLSAYGVL